MAMEKLCVMCKGGEKSCFRWVYGTVEYENTVHLVILSV